MTWPKSFIDEGGVEHFERPPTREEYYDKAMEQLHLNSSDAPQYLLSAYHIAMREMEDLKKRYEYDAMLSNNEIEVRLKRVQGREPVSKEVLARMGVLTLLNKWEPK